VRQFDFYENPFVSSRATAPFLVVLSSHLMRQTDVVIAAPLVRDREKQVTEIEVRLQVGDEDLILSLADMGGLEAKILRRRLGSLSEHEDAIRRGISRVFTGF
jgi:hypothetical protein